MGVAHSHHVFLNRPSFGQQDPKLVEGHDKTIALINALPQKDVIGHDNYRWKT
jgi:hypothetical protein